MNRTIDSTPVNRLDAFLGNQEVGLQEVNATEMTQVDGGFPIALVVALIGALAGYLKSN